ncbi:hypothetical protein BU17DRAFT_48042, partial [Hysterangium stoloniferum]
GASSSAESRSPAYNGLLEMQVGQVGNATASVIGRVQLEVEDWTGQRSTEGRIWKSVRNKQVQRNVCNFLSKSLHGSYTTSIPSLERRAECERYQSNEDIEHILLGCECPSRGTIWRLVEKVWSSSGDAWPRGATLGRFWARSGRL